jgi:hypothetical protein
VLRWRDLALRYGDDPILNRADAIYEGLKAFAGHGRNSDAKMTGVALLEAFRRGKDCWVGRGGGLEGDRFREDVRNGTWMTQQYEVNTAANEAPSRNFFCLRDFVRAIGQDGSGPGRMS